MSYRVPAPIRPLRLAPPARAPEAEERLDDEGLIDAIIQGDARRARHVHDRLIGAIEPTLYRVLGKRPLDHDDLVQTTFEQVVISLRRRRFARGCSLSTWAAAIAAHVALNALRSQRSSRRVFDPVDISDVLDDPDVVDARVVGNAERDLGVRAKIWAAQAHLMAMNPERAIVLILHDILEHSLAEIAAMQGVSVAAAQSRLVRGRREFMKRAEAEDTSPWGD